MYKLYITTHILFLKICVVNTSLPASLFFRVHFLIRVVAFPL
jgi:hypothetical protein